MYTHSVVHDCPPEAVFLWRGLDELIAQFENDPCCPMLTVASNGGVDGDCCPYMVVSQT